MQSDETKPGVKSQRTVDYSALERTCNSPKGDPRSDIYFLGCVFYQMVTGQLPMEESESKDMLRKMLKRSFGAIKPINEHRYAPERGNLPDHRKDDEDRLEGPVSKHGRRRRRISSAIEALDRSSPQRTLRSPRLVRRSPISSMKSSICPAASEDTAAVAAEPKEELQHFEVKAVAAKSVLCVEAQTEIQDALRKSLTNWGYRALLVVRCRDEPPSGSANHRSTP